MYTLTIITIIYISSLSIINFYMLRSELAKSLLTRCRSNGT